MNKQDILDNGIVIFQSAVKTIVRYNGMNWACSTEYYKARKGIIKNEEK